MKELAAKKEPRDRIPQATRRTGVIGAPKTWKHLLCQSLADTRKSRHEVAMGACAHGRATEGDRLKDLVSRPHAERKEARGSIASEAVREANAMEAGDWREAAKPPSRSTRAEYAIDGSLVLRDAGFACSSGRGNLSLDRSAAHHFEAKTGASRCRIFFFNRHMPDEMYPGRLMVKAAKIMPAKISIK